MATNHEGVSGIIGYKFIILLIAYTFILIKSLDSHWNPRVRNICHYTNWIKGLITVGRELRQQHPSDLLSDAGTSREWLNMTKQRCMKRIYDKIRPKSPPNRATSPTWLHCDVTDLSLTTGVVALHIPSWRIEVREERRQARKIVWPVNAGRVICRYQNNLCGIINHHKHNRYCSFLCLSRGFKHLYYN